MNKKILNGAVLTSFCLALATVVCLMITAEASGKNNIVSGSAKNVNPVNSFSAAADAPDWAVGTFTARNPQTGGTITMTINRNGDVTVELQGAVTYGTLRGTNLRINNAVARVRRTNNGFTTTRRDNGERIEYFRAGFGGGNGGSQGGNYYVPNWAVGTFYGKNPQNGGQIALTIESNGNVTANFNGAVSYGKFFDNQITIDNATSRVEQINNGIRTRRTDNGERIDYSRSGFGNGGNQGGNYYVPNWAIGTFYAKNPQNGGQITMTIESNGNVTVNFDGSVSYGKFNRDTLTINNAVARVERINNGIRTRRTDNGERIDYYR